MRLDTRTRRHRRGVTLPELLATMAVLAVAMGLAVALIEILLKIGDSGQKAREHEATIARLARAFRSDLHAARKIGRLDRERLELEAMDDGRSVGYMVEGGEVVRLEWSGIVLKERERFRLAKGTGMRFERIEGIPGAALVLDRRMVSDLPKAKEGRRVVERIEGVLARDARFAGEATR